MQITFSRVSLREIHFPYMVLKSCYNRGEFRSEPFFFSENGNIVQTYITSKETQDKIQPATRMFCYICSCGTVKYFTMHEIPPSCPMKFRKCHHLLQHITAIDVWI